MARKSAPTCETEKKPFPTRLRKLMQENHVTQKTLGDAVGVRPQTISLYCTGQSLPDAEGITKICNFFDVSADWILGLSNSRLMDAELKSVCHYTGLDDSSVDRIRQIHSLAVRQAVDNKASWAKELGKDFSLDIALDLTFWYWIKEIINSGLLDSLAIGVQRCQENLAKSIHTLDSITNGKENPSTVVGKVEKAAEQSDELYHKARYEVFELTNALNDFVKPLFERYEKNVNKIYNLKLNSVIDNMACEGPSEDGKRNEAQQ